VPYKLPDKEWMVYHLLMGCVSRRPNTHEMLWPFHHNQLASSWVESEGQHVYHCHACGKTTTARELALWEGHYAEALHY
jgi:hypothetical protein